MQVPPDLASRLQDLASSHGRSPEVVLREAISRMIEDASAAPALRQHVTASALEIMAPEQAPHRHTVFVPQALSVSIYE